MRLFVFVVLCFLMKSGVIVQKRCIMYMANPFEDFYIRRMIEALDPEADPVCFIFQKKAARKVVDEDTVCKFGNFHLQEYRAVYPKTFHNGEILDLYFITPKNITDPILKERFERVAPRVDLKGYAYDFEAYTSSESVDSIKHQANWTTVYEHCRQQ